jgi:hypothetical protein
MNIFRGVAVFIGWLTGSLAGIAAILYVFGYLISIAQLHLLGLDAQFFGYANPYYVQEGGKFLISVGQYLGDIFLNLLIAVAIFTFPILIILMIVLFFKREKLREYRDRWKNNMNKIGEKWPLLWRGLAFTLLLILLFYLSADPQSFNDPLEISNLLFTSESHQTTSDTADKIRSLLIKGETESLKTYFLDCLLFELKAGILLFLAWLVTSPWRLRLLAISPFVIIFMLYTIFLPMLYGVLNYQMKFPVINLSSDNEMLLNRSGNLYLINKTDGEFILWDCSKKEVLWVPQSEIKAAEIKQTEFLFNTCQGKND